MDKIYKKIDGFVNHSVGSILREDKSIDPIKMKQLLWATIMGQILRGLENNNQILIGRNLNNGSNYNVCLSCKCLEI